MPGKLVVVAGCAKVYTGVINVLENFHSSQGEQQLHVSPVNFHWQEMLFDERKTALVPNRS